jgi:hypothetical protein
MAGGENNRRYQKLLDRMDSNIRKNVDENRGFDKIREKGINIPFENSPANRIADEASGNMGISAAARMSEQPKRKDLGLREDVLNKREYEDLVRRIDKNKDPTRLSEEISDLFLNKDAYAGRDFTEAAAGRFAKENLGVKTADDLIKHYEKPEVLSNLNIVENPKLLEQEGAHGIYYPKQKKIVLPTGEDISTAIHEFSHPYDELAHGYYNLSDALTGNKAAKGMNLGAKGLEAIEDLNRGHFFRDDLKGLSQLVRMIKGQKLRGLAVPALGALGAAGALMGTAEKAQAGDIPGAALSAASVVDPTGVASAASQVRERLQHPELAKQYAKEDYLSALPPGLDLEESAIQDNEDALKLDKFEKLKNKLQTP